MDGPSPLHRDPESDGADYGCFSDEANDAVANLVYRLVELINEGTFTTEDEIVDLMREELREIGEGATDTVVKENVLLALGPAIQEAGIPFDKMAIYGW